MHARKGYRLLGLVLALLVAGRTALAVNGAAEGKRGEIIVFAAASLKNALDAVAAQWHADTGKAAIIAYGASSALAKQLEQGAPAQVFISADGDWMNYVAQRGLIRPATRVNLLSNRLVLVTRRDAGQGTTQSVEITKDFALVQRLGEGRLAVANVAAVPAGKYAKAALERLSLWDGVEKRIAQAENVRAALLLVARGEAPLGIVYATDAAAEPGVAVIGTFPEDSHPPIIYPIALSVSATAAAEDFLAHVRSDRARPLFEAQGFAVLPSGRS